MPESYAANVGTIYIPQVNETNYVTGSTSLRQTLITLGNSCYSAGNTVPTAGLQNSAVTTAKIADGAVTSAKLASSITIGVLANDTYFKARNAANSADDNLLKYNSSDQLQFDALISQLRYKNNAYFLFRNAANNADINGFKLDTNDDLVIGPELSQAIMKQNTYFQGRNAADSAYINGWKINASDAFQIGANTEIPGQLDLNIGASGDPKIVFDINGTDERYIGVDDSDSDALCIGAGAAVGTNTHIKISEAGEVTMPLQSSVLAMATSVTNVTGDGTNYTIAWGTEVYDQNSDFAANTFTAPQTGKYLVICAIDMGGYVAANNSSLALAFVASNRTLYPAILYDDAFTVVDYITFNGSAVIDMDAGDTLTISLVGAGAAKGIDVSATSYLAIALLH